MDQKVKTEWVKALRSGEYEQGRNALVVAPVGEKPRYCCLGVLCDLAVKADVENIEWSQSRRAFRSRSSRNGEWFEMAGTLSHVVMEWAGLNSDNPQVEGWELASWNDGVDDVDAERIAPQDFQKIADLIERNL